MLMKLAYVCHEGAACLPKELHLPVTQTPLFFTLELSEALCSSLSVKPSLDPLRSS